MEWWYELFQLFYTMIFSVVKIDIKNKLHLSS